MNAFWSEIKREIEKFIDAKIGQFNYFAVAGGDINEAFKIAVVTEHAEILSFFIKLNSFKQLDLFRAEFNGLLFCNNKASIKIPNPIKYGMISDKSYLLMEYIDFDVSNKGSPNSLRDFGFQLAGFHKVFAERFGFEEDNFIGATPQINCWNDSWKSFWFNCRIFPQLKLLEQKFGKISKISKGIEILYGNFDDFFKNYDPKPSLVHGDLWQGNFGFTHLSEPVIFDMACYFGDHEVDLAMLELFGNPGDAFFSAYDSVFKIEEGYTERKKLYNLYHVINHAILFGGGYIQQAHGMIEQLNERCSS